MGATKFLLHLTLFLAPLLIFSPALAQQTPRTPIEDREDILDLTDAQVKELAEMIRLYGYSCDSISSARRFFMGRRGFVVKCNHFNYSYEIEDRGGNWVVCYDVCD